MRWIVSLFLEIQGLTPDVLGKTSVAYPFLIVTVFKGLQNRQNAKSLFTYNQQQFGCNITVFCSLTGYLLHLWIHVISLNIKTTCSLSKVSTASFLEICNAAQNPFPPSGTNIFLPRRSKIFLHNVWDIFPSSSSSLYFYPWDMHLEEISRHFGASL